MSNNELNALQVNFKTSAGSLFNVYGKTAEDFEVNLKMFNALLSDILATESAVANGGGSVVDQVQRTFNATIVTPQAAPAPRAAAPAASSAGQAPHCAHGEMNWVAPAGKPWKGWFCPLPKDATGKCDPQFVKG